MKKFFLIILPLSVLSVKGHAEILDINGMVPGENKTVSITYNSNTFSVFAGPQMARIGSGDWFDAYCVDLAHWNNGTDYSVDKFFLSDTSLNPRIGQLYNKFSASVNSGSEGAGLQLAIWDVLVDGGDGLGLGNFKASGLTSGTLNWYNSYLADPLMGISSQVYVYNATSHPNGKFQNVIGPVPEPASMAAIAVGLAGLLRRRKKQAKL